MGETRPLSQQLATTTIRDVAHLVALVSPALVQLYADLCLPGYDAIPSASTSVSTPSPTAIDPAKFVRRQLALCQRQLVPLFVDWLPAATTDHERTLLTAVSSAWFIPPTPLTPDPAAARIKRDAVLETVPLLLSLLKAATPPQVAFVSSTLADLVAAWPIHVIHANLVGEDARASSTKGDDADERWTRYLNDLEKVPRVVANAYGRIGDLRAIPDQLTEATYLATLASQYILLLSTTSITSQSVALPVSFLVPVFPPLLLPHLLPPPFPASPEALITRETLQHSWWSAITVSNEKVVEKVWTAALAIVGAFLRDTDPNAASSKAGGFVLLTLLGPLFPSRPSPKSGTEADAVDEGDDDEAANLPLHLLIDPRHTTSTVFDEHMASAVVDWAIRTSEGDGGPSPNKLRTGRDEFWERLVMTWCDEKGIKEASESSRIYLSTLLLLLLHRLPSPESATLARSLSLDPLFLRAVSSHLGIQKEGTRLSGMLVAEEVSTLAQLGQAGEGTKLDFGVWSGGGPPVARLTRVRERLSKQDPSSGRDQEETWKALLRERLQPASAPSKPVPRQLIVSTPPASLPTHPATTDQSRPRQPLIQMVDPDDLQPLHELSPPPSQDFIEELETGDASLYSTLLPKPSASQTRARGKLRPPVYIAELTSYLRGQDPEGRKEDADEEAERMMVGLRDGEVLVRRKSGWGGEVEENAVDLAIVLAGLQDRFELEGFEDLKLRIMVALVRACPDKVAPTLVEQYFFPSYSLHQRHSILTALALGARELAGLPPPPPTPMPTSKLAGSPSPTGIEAFPTPEISLFPSKRLPLALHNRLAPPSSTQPPRALPSGAIEAITSTLADTVLTSAKKSAEEAIPEARREKLLTVRRFASAKSPITEAQTPSTFPSLAAEFFILPLINRLFLHLHDLSTGLATSTPYSTSPSTSSPILDSLLLPTYLMTLSILLHAARHSPHFLHLLAPEALELVLVIRSITSNGDGDGFGVGLVGKEETILASEMEVLLVVLDNSVAIDGGSTLMRGKDGEGGRLDEQQLAYF
ncbi:hypothetical protein MNV49_007465 [Pseudohyphozyma bogoriensis]|nr:hypothetical protein MNV49_007465 [Pseudohyphozyma bogoriensis]